MLFRSEVVFSEAGSQSPDLRFTVAVRGTGTVGPLFSNGFETGNLSAWSGHTP